MCLCAGIIDTSPLMSDAYREEVREGEMVYIPLVKCLC